MRTQTTIRALFAAAVSALALIGCGGGNSDLPSSAAAFGDPANAVAAIPTAFAQRKRLGVAVGAKDAGAALTYADILFNWAEGVLPEYFPGHSSTLVEGPWFYRSYFATGIMLGVNSGNVYVLGGVFGAVPINVGRISDYVAAPNTAPVANAGTAQNVSVGSLVTLNGSGSSDANGDPISFRWTLASKPLGSGAFLAGATTSAPTFIADLPGSYVAQLVVSDGAVNSAVASVTITATTASLFCGASNGYGTNGIQLYTPTNNFTYSLSSTAAFAYDIVTLTWGAKYTGIAGSYTGSLKTRLWAVKAPYYGGAISGTVLGEFFPNFTGYGAYSVNQIASGGYSVNTIQSTVGNYNPAAGPYCMVITLLQYMPGQCTPSADGYCIVDWLQFASPATFR